MSQRLVRPWRKGGRRIHRCVIWSTIPQGSWLRKQTFSAPIASGRETPDFRGISDCNESLLCLLSWQAVYHSEDSKNKLAAVHSQNALGTGTNGRWRHGPVQYLAQGSANDEEHSCRRGSSGQHGFLRAFLFCLMEGAYVRFPQGGGTRLIAGGIAAGPVCHLRSGVTHPAAAVACRLAEVLASSGAVGA
ncbi:MAG: hypothetical protein RLY31_3213 [Bacteroidota bacterium]